ncbi:MAG TPA: BlaI/MecI/CopY family transcriptional regulator [Candidatus Polarisedimenticolaceae bacterium]|nr:BlaI/MecI/CopY family transcriptional regulator [Candidatus Polarisedimenticolaceae bacterium]
MGRGSLGEQETQILKEIVENGPGSVGELQVRFGEPRGLARSTVLTMMERLRAKGYLVRQRQGGVFRYAPRAGRDVLSGVVGRFVENALGGSLSPFVAYLSGRERVTDEELRDLQRAVDRLRSRRRETRS